MVDDMQNYAGIVTAHLPRTSLPGLTRRVIVSRTLWTNLELVIPGLARSLSSGGAKAPTRWDHPGMTTKKWEDWHK